MPPKAKITKEMIINAAIEITKEQGYESINARTISNKLGCSTQPVLYLFSTIEEIKRAVYESVDNYHTNWLMNIEAVQDPMLEIGLNYIRFAIEQPNLFKFLFQSGYTKEKSLIEMVDSEELLPLLQMMMQTFEMDMNNTKRVFVSLALFAHGYASLIANNELKFDEMLVSKDLDMVYRGALLAIKEEENEEVL